MQSDPRHYPQRPLLGVSAVVSRDGQVLLVKRGRPPFEGQWSFPGGLVELGDKLKDAAAREVREESGIETDVGEQIETVEIIERDESGRIARHYVLAVFAARWRSGDLRAGDDAADVLWVDPLDAARLGMTPDTARILARVAAR